MIIFAFILFASTTPSKIVLECPKQIETKQELVSEAESWHVSKDSPNRFDREEFKDFSTTTKNHGGNVFGFSWGIPDNMETFAPDQTQKLSHNRRGSLSIWKFTNTDGIYYICGYHQTTIQLSKPLPKGYKKCFIENDGSNYKQTAWCEK